MVRWLFTLLIFLLAGPVWAQDYRPLAAQGPEEFNFEEPFEQALSNTLLRSLLSAAAANFHEYVEFEGRMAPEGSSTPPSGEFRLKFFPQGKSRSQDHVTAEGSFRLSPNRDASEFSLRFKSSPGRSQAPSAIDGEPI